MLLLVPLDAHQQVGGLAQLGGANLVVAHGETLVEVVVEGRLEVGALGPDLALDILAAPVTPNNLAHRANAMGQRAGDGEEGGDEHEWPHAGVGHNHLHYTTLHTVMHIQSYSLHTLL